MSSCCNQKRKVATLREEKRDLDKVRHSFSSFEFISFICGVENSILYIVNMRDKILSPPVVAQLFCMRPSIFCFYFLCLPRRKFFTARLIKLLFCGSSSAVPEMMSIWFCDQSCDKRKKVFSLHINNLKHFLYGNKRKR